MKPTRTPGPWKVRPGGTDCTSRVHAIDDGDWVAETFNGSKHRANAERIVACVNAMEGIEDPAAARALLDDPRTAAATDMLAALKAAWEMLEALRCNPDNADFKQIEAVIAKAEGRKP